MTKSVRRVHLPQDDYKCDHFGCGVTCPCGCKTYFCTDCDKVLVK